MDGLDNKIIVVCGPTATGKTDLAAELCRIFGGELVNADSMQVYRGLTVGTAAPTPGQLAGVPLHLVGTVDPKTRYSVAEWLQDAGAAIRDIISRGALPVLCGGTGLYVQSLAEGIRFTEEPDDLELRAELEAQWEADGGRAVLQRLAMRDPDRAKQLHPNDKKRIIRALEQVLATGLTAAERDALSHREKPAYQVLLLGLNCAQRAELYERINRRVDAMMDAGLLGEAQLVWENKRHYKTAAQAIGYKEFFPYFRGEAPLEDCVAKLKQATRNYAKRQLTWFGRMPGMHWLTAGAPGTYDAADELVGAFLAE